MNKDAFCNVALNLCELRNCPQICKCSASLNVCPTLLPKDTWDIFKARRGRRKENERRKKFSKRRTDFFFSVPRHNIDRVLFFFSLV